MAAEWEPRCERVRKQLWGHNVVLLEFLLLPSSLLPLPPAEPLSPFWRPGRDDTCDEGGFRSRPAPVIWGFRGLVGGCAFRKPLPPPPPPPHVWMCWTGRSRQIRLHSFLPFMAPTEDLNLSCLWCFLETGRERGSVHGGGGEDTGSDISQKPTESNLTRKTKPIWEWGGHQNLKFSFPHLSIWVTMSGTFFSSFWCINDAELFFLILTVSGADF